MQTIPRSLARRLIAALSVVVVSCGVLVAATETAAHAAFTTCVVGPTCPLANDDNYNVGFDKTLTVTGAQAPTIGLLANDSGPAGTHVDTTVSDTISFNGATVNIQSNGAFSYIPDPTNPFSGIDSFNYEITDGAAGDTADATAYITVIPAVVNDSYYTRVNQTLNVAAPGVFANDDITGIDTASIVNDPTTTPGNVPVTVNDDGSFSYTPPTNFSGVDSFSYTVDDLAFNNEYTATVTIHIDSTPPAVSMSAPATVTLGTKIPVAWTGSDASGVARYTVQETSAPWNGAFVPWANWKVATLPGSAVFTGTYGRTYCFRTLAVDRAGNATLTPNRCTVVPLRVGSLGQSTGWTLVSNTAYFGSSAKTTRTRLASLNRTSAQGRHFYLVATVCSTCGTVQIRWNNVVTANVNLAHATTVHRVVFTVAALPAVQAGTLSIIVTSSARPVIIEGLGVLRQ